MAHRLFSAGKSKTTKTTNETEYRAILDTIISDVLTVLYWPEWPGAALLLIVVCKLLVSVSSFKFVMPILTGLIFERGMHLMM